MGILDGCLIVAILFLVLGLVRQRRQLADLKDDYENLDWHVANLIREQCPKTHKAEVK